MDKVGGMDKVDSMNIRIGWILDSIDKVDSMYK